jgi:preprotein translocase subunit SecG
VVVVMVMAMVVVVVVLVVVGRHARASASFHKQLTKDANTVTRRHLLVGLTGQGAVSHPHRDEES